jgi:hypothetical protein
MVYISPCSRTSLDIGPSTPTRSHHHPEVNDILPDGE